MRRAGSVGDEVHRITREVRVHLFTFARAEIDAIVGDQCLERCATDAQVHLRDRADVDELLDDADLQASQVVAAQDVDICERVQRGYTPGIDTRGRLVLPHEDGVHHIHRLLRAALS